MERITYKSDDRDLNNQILNLLCEAFGTEYRDYYLMQIAHLPSREHTKLLADHNGRLVAHTQVVDYFARLDQETEPLKVAYLFAVCTSKAYQGQGIMTKFLYQILDELREQGYAASYLIPAEIWLSDYYRRFGFRLMHGEIYTKAPKGATPIVFPGVTAQDYLSDVAQYERKSMEQSEFVAHRSAEWQILLPRQIGWMLCPLEDQVVIPIETPLLSPLT